MTQQIQSLYVGIPEVPMPVMPEVALLGKNKFEAHAYSWDISKGVLFIDDSRLINKVAYKIKEARPSYSSLMNYGMNQRLLEENKVPEEYMRAAFKKFDEDIWQRYFIWAEFMDSLPEKRGHKLPKGKDVALYRGVKVNGEDIDASGVEPVFLKLPKEAGTITEEWRDALGASEGTYHYPADLDYSKRNLDGLNALRWVFWSLEGPDLYSNWGPWYGSSGGGVLLGSRLSAEKLVKQFPAVKISEYQIQLKELEKDLASSRKLYEELGGKITSIEERLSKLREMKPE